MRTGAAPATFPSWGRYIDGGVIANNPALCALAQVRKTGAALEDVRLLSIGTGVSLQYIAGKDHDWGVAQWIKILIPLILNGSIETVHFQCAQLLGSAYHRLAPTFPPDVTVGTDELKKIPYLVEFASQVDLAPTLEWLGANW